MKERPTYSELPYEHREALWIWLCGLNEASPPEHIAAAASDFRKHVALWCPSGLSLMGFASWVMKQAAFAEEASALTEAMGSSEWWWTALDQKDGLRLVDLGQLTTQRAPAPGEWAPPMPPAPGSSYMDGIKLFIACVNTGELAPAH
jgi:hypothetical protein